MAEARPRTLRCEGVRVARRRPGGPERLVLDAVDVAFELGAVSLITGPTGAGKSTLLQVLGGLLRPTEGAVFDGDRPVSRWVAAHRDRWRREVGMATQDPRLLDDLSALENVILPLVPRGVGVDEARERARAALRSVGSAALAPARAAALSGGERQRVALARALVVAPRWLLVDEPTAHQDATATDVVLAALARARGAGAGVVVTGHDPRLIDADLADARFTLTDGHLERA
ncbi:MAG: hypothetical protein CSA66_04920 [Proteobacteria bacterium]|nr:MAG: hypothetical protein CSA66_04920 [Pseudomonadota bacterium]